MLWPVAVSAGCCSFPAWVCVCANGCSVGVLPLQLCSVGVLPLQLCVCVCVRACACVCARVRSYGYGGLGGLLLTLYRFCDTHPFGRWRQVGPVGPWPMCLYVVVARDVFFLSVAPMEAALGCLVSMSVAPSARSVQSLQLDSCCYFRFYQ
jgi:hypothetical protein